ERIADLHARYEAELTRTLDRAKDSQDARLSDEQQSLMAEIRRSRPIVDSLDREIVAYVDYTQAKAAEISADASATATRTQLLMALVAVVGIVVGLACGYLVSQTGVVRPLKAVVDCLRRLADGD